MRKDINDAVCLVAFPASSSPPTPKHQEPHNRDRPHAPVKHPFIIDDDDSEDDDAAQENCAIARKRLRLNADDTQEARTSPSPAAHPQRLPDTCQTSRPAHDAGPRLRIPGFNFQLSGLGSLSSPFTTSPLAPSRVASYTIKSCGGDPVMVTARKSQDATTFEAIIAARSKTKEGRAKRNYYGIEIHQIINDMSKVEMFRKHHVEPRSDKPGPIPDPSQLHARVPKKTLLWTEKYRAKSFFDLCGDDGTNRAVLRWLKGWDPIVFPNATRSRRGLMRRPGIRPQAEEQLPHRKILMLAGPPGLGKTTLAHACARQAGYEVLEINASDYRSRDVVKTRIRTSLGTESVKTVINAHAGHTGAKPARPACVIVDEVDGVVSGSGAAGEGGFIKALLDLILVDQSNQRSFGDATAEKRRKRADDFKLMRPLILICNEIYHPSLRPLRQSNLAEIIHVGKPTLDAVVGRLKGIFDKEGICCEKDAVRKICEAAWGLTSGIDVKRGMESTVEGDLRGIMVVGEWVAGRFRSSSGGAKHMLTRSWVEQHVLPVLANGAAGARGIGRSSVRDIVSRLFQEGGGFPKQSLHIPDSHVQHEQPKAELGVGELRKKYAMDRLLQMIEASGEIGAIATDVFTAYPSHDFKDDCFLSKPNQAYDWLHFHDACQTRLFASQEWELAPYLGQPLLACHHLFASPRKHWDSADRPRSNMAGASADDENPLPTPFSGPRADYQAREAEKQNRAVLQGLQAQLSPSLVRTFRSAEDVATELLPSLLRRLSPDVKPVVVSGSQGTIASVRRETEREMVRRAAEVLADVGVALEKGKIGSDGFVARGPQYVYRMNPDLDALSTFETAASLLLPSQAPTRFAIRQVLDQELRRTVAQRESSARQARFQAGHRALENTPPRPAGAPMDRAAGSKAGFSSVSTKRDFFGRIIQLPTTSAGAGQRAAQKEDYKVWVTFHEGLNNAVRRPLSLMELIRDL